jgi:hypothetical protein
MDPISKIIRLTLLTAVFGMGLSTFALSVDREVYDKPDVKPGKIIRGKVMDVDQKSPQSWNVSVKDRETGETVILHIDNTTTRKDIMMKPDLGDNVIAKYNQQNNHAFSFLTDETMNR